MSRDRCCAGTDSTYSIHVGRARDIAGPFIDPDGRNLALDGGTTLLATDAQVGPGGQSLSLGYLGYHH